MFSFFIGLVIALFIAITGFGSFLFKLSNANRQDMNADRSNFPDITQEDAGLTSCTETKK